MNAIEYCGQVEQDEILLKRRCRDVRIVDDNSPLVSLKNSRANLEFEPCIVADYGYLVREAVFDKIERISRRLNKDHKTLIIRSAWRSFSHQRLLWQNRIDNLSHEHPEIHLRELTEMAEYFIAPETKSMHSTGGAVDALMYDLDAARVMDFGTNVGLKINLGRKCYPFHPDLAPHAKKNRQLLIGLFEEEGFVVDLQEYWHFDYGNVVWAIKKAEVHAIYDVIESA